MAKKKAKKMKDPMVLILAALFLFITGGAAIRMAVYGPMIEYTICLDAAYGEEAKGNKGIISEADYNAAFVKVLEERLKADTRFITKLTHAEGEHATVADRAAKISAEHPDLVISVHCGYDPSVSVSATKIYADVPGSKSNEKSLAAANAFKDALSSETNTPEVWYQYYEPISDNTFQISNVPVTETAKSELATWSLMEKSNAPVIVIEQFNVANQEAVTAFSSEEGMKQTAELYYKALLKLYGLN